MKKSLNKYLKLKKFFKSTVHLNHNIILHNSNWFKYLISQLEYTQNKIKSKKRKILDFGCGSGFTSLAMAEIYGHEVKGCDISPKYQDFWRLIENKYRNIEFSKNEPDNLPYKSGEFDTLMMFGVLEHVNRPHIILNEIFRILQNNSYIFIFNYPNNTALFERLIGPFILNSVKHEISMNKKYLKKLIEMHGFDVKEIWVSHFLPMQFGRSSLTRYKKLKFYLNKIMNSAVYGLIDSKLSKIFPILAQSINLCAVKRIK